MRLDAEPWCAQAQGLRGACLPSAQSAALALSGCDRGGSPTQFSRQACACASGWHAASASALPSPCKGPHYRPSRLPTGQRIPCLILHRRCLCAGCEPHAQSLQRERSGPGDPPEEVTAYQDSRQACSNFVCLDRYFRHSAERETGEIEGADREGEGERGGEEEGEGEGEEERDLNTRKQCHSFESSGRSAQF